VKDADTDQSQLTAELQAALMTWKFRRYGTGQPQLPEVQEAEDRFFMLWRWTRLCQALVSS
jgi:hypothetical protein